jgi:hypothetical protein
VLPPIVGIVQVDILRLIIWLLARKKAIACQAIGATSTMQVEGTILRVWKRPICFFAPSVDTHHKDLDRLLLFKTFIDPFEPVIEPADLGM